MMNYMMHLVLLLGFTLPLSAQVSDSLLEDYNYRIQQEYLNDVYIPIDIADALNRLDELIDEESKIKFAEKSEEEAHTRLHFSFGLWMIHNWSFYDGSRLSHYLRGKGVFFPDDMAKVIMRLYHRKLNAEDLNVEELCTFYAERRAKEWDEKQKKKN